MKRLLLLGYCLLLTACASTEMASFVDPQYKSYHANSVVVRVSGANLDETLKSEQEFANQLLGHHVKVIKFTDIIPPTRDYSAAQQAKLLRKAGADSMLTVSVTHKDSKESYVPPVHHAGQTTTQVNYIGNMPYVTTHTTPGYTTAGYTVSSSVMSSLSTLIELSTGNEIWRGEGVSSGDQEYLELLLSAGEAAIEDLEEKSLIPKGN